MEKDIDILTFGDTCVDLILSGGDVVPEFGQKEKLIGNYNLEMGGSNCIFACQAAKLGLRTAVVAKVGKDPFGGLMLQTMKEAGVQMDHVRPHPTEKTGITVAISTGSDRAMLTYNGTIDTFEPRDLPDELLARVRHLHIGSYFIMKRLQRHYPQIIQKLKLYGATISLDTNWDPEEKWESGLKEILPLIDIFFPNENEAMAISKTKTIEEAAAKLLKIVPIVAMKLGKAGAKIYNKKQFLTAASLEQPVVDTVGAGDCFDAGFLYGYLNHMPLEKSARIGCICGSLSVRAAGGTKGQPKLEEVNAFFRT